MTDRQDAQMTTELTQKELMYHLLNTMQHSAKREELSDARKELRAEMKHLSTKYDRSMFLLVSLIVAVFFKEQIFVLFAQS